MLQILFQTQVVSNNASTSRHRRNVPRNTNRSSTSTTGTTRSLIERSRSANSRNFHVVTNRETGPSSTAKGASTTTKRGVFAKANERKKRNIAAKSSLNTTSNKTSNATSTNESENKQENHADDASQVEFFHINNVTDMLDDKDLTETSIDEEMAGNGALKSRVNNMTVEFIGCSPKHESYLNDEYNFVQTLPRSYKIQSRRKDSEKMDSQYHPMPERGSTEGDDSDNNLLSRFDMTKSVKSILTVQEKLTQDFPSLPPQVKKDIIRLKISYILE